MQALECRPIVGFVEQVCAVRWERHDNLLTRTAFNLPGHLHGQLLAGGQDAVQEARGAKLLEQLDSRGESDLTGTRASQVDVLRANAERCAPPDSSVATHGKRCRGIHRTRVARDAHTVRTDTCHLHREKIHPRRADETGDEPVARQVVECERRADLFHPTPAQDDDLVGHCHRFDLVMGHVDHRRLQALVQRGDLGSHLHAQLGVEVRQRFVEKKDGRLADDGAAYRNALALAA